MDIFRAVFNYRTKLKRDLVSLTVHLHKKKKFPFKNFFNKCDQTRSFLSIWSHLLNKSFIICVAVVWKFYRLCMFEQCYILYHFRDMMLLQFVMILSENLAMSFIMLNQSCWNHICSEQLMKGVTFCLLKIVRISLTFLVC